MMHWRSW